MQVEITIAKNGSVQLKMVAENKMEYAILEELSHQQPVKVCYPDAKEKEPDIMYIIGKERAS